MDEDSHDFLRTGREWLWENRVLIAGYLTQIRQWLFRQRDESKILIIGPGGVGKSTTAKLLAGEYDAQLNIPSSYNESIGLEHFSLRDDPNVGLVVPPGQSHRRDATWNTIQSAIAAGEYGGAIILASYGFHTLGKISYKRHRLYQGNDEAFLSAFLEDSRREEIRVLERLSPFLSSNPNDFWLLSLVTKQDLWWRWNDAVGEHYRTGVYGQQVDKLVRTVGAQRFRHELVLGSMVISNFVTGVGELIAETASGYEQQMQVESLHRLWETLDALRMWDTK